MAPRAVLPQRSALDAAATAAEGNDQNPSEGTIMTTVAPDSDIVEDIRAIIDANSPMRIASGPLFAEPQTEIVKATGHINGDIVYGESTHTFGRLFNTDGERIGRGCVVHGVSFHASVEPNVAQAVDGNVFVSDGLYIALEPATLDGAPAVRLVTFDEMLRRRKAEVIAQYPHLDDMRPTWADETNIYPGACELEIEFARHVGNVAVSQFVTILANGALDAGEIGFSVHTEEINAVDDLRQLQADISAALDILDGEK